MDIVAVFCDVDEFCQHFEPAFRQHLITNQVHYRQRSGPVRLLHGYWLAVDRKLRS